MPVVWVRNTNPSQKLNLNLNLCGELKVTDAEIRLSFLKRYRNECCCAWVSPITKLHRIRSWADN